MSRGQGFDVVEWGIGWSAWEEAGQSHRESVLALSNGHLGWRGNLDEGDPCGAAGTYLNGVFEEHPMPYAEDGYGYPDQGQTVINVPDGKIIRLLVDDEPFDIRTGRLRTHEQFLDFRAGVLRRVVEWTSPAGRTVRITSSRLVSLAHRSVAAVDYEVTAIDAPVEVTLLSEIVANEPLPDVHPDPRVMEPLRQPLASVGHFAGGARATLLHRTQRSGISVAVAVDHQISGARDARVDSETSPDLARTTVNTRLGAGGSIRLTKLVGHEWSDSLADAALRDRAEAAVEAAMRLGWDGIAQKQREYLDDFWSRADVRIGGSARLQQSVRFAMFQVLQSAARAEVRSIPGKGLTGAGYEGHTFWDADAFVLPVLIYTAPGAARDALLWRHATIGHARRRAEQLHLAGAAFPWRTIDGRECSGYWPAGTIAFHINADVAAAVVRYVAATGDAEFERDYGTEILVETARLWVALGRWDDRGSFHIDGVTGPDEYSALVDDNVFTNLMAQKNLRAAGAAARRHPEQSRALGVSDEEVAGWETAASALHIPFDAERGVHQQSAGFTEQERWDFDATTTAQYPLHSHFPYFDLYRKQVVKQADLVLALQFVPEAFTSDETARAFAYYEELTVRDSSLSASPQAVVAARVGHLGLAMDYLMEAATIDLDDLHDNVDDGLHIAALAGVWNALVCGFGGMRDGENGLQFAPRLTVPMSRLSFGILVEGRTLRVDVEPDATTYRLSAGAPLDLRHFGVLHTVEAGVPLELPTPALPAPSATPSQPRGRAPRDVAGE
ncbi:glycoside hydrolase family 65 protein [Microbacterium sp. CFH 90308]|uniref:Glycoside hydrolase family 65 protein n=1 Tax=Microbacterium salsuginis TaxID=2722803 RepID=A0ABX1K8B1_9MICO|nr:glycoside hydrolase family 65 protein [Microbacterium sp. CFH 90308]NLP83249.1 glycoside hydrolase family 65 protein [Microbacterium sp. CFH 90308]